MDDKLALRLILTYELQLQAWASLCESLLPPDAETITSARTELLTPRQRYYRLEQDQSIEWILNEKRGMPEVTP